MSITDLGSLTLGAIVPAAADATASIGVACDIAAPNVSGQLSALASFTPSASLSLADQLTIANAIVTNIQAAIAAGVTAPSLADQAAAAASVIATLEGSLATINAQVSLAAAVAALLATGGVQLLAFSGARNVLGSELSTALGSSSTSAHALVLVTTSGAAWTAMQGVFKTS